MKNFLRYSFVALMAMIMGNAFAQEVVFDFTDEANPWGFPTEQLKETGTFTKDGKSIVITTTNYTRWFSDSKALLIGKEGATLTLPAFDFDVEKIEVVGHDGASGKVTHNIFVGDEAVSTEVTGAKGTSSFEIAAGKQAAGTIYVLKVTNANNDQICKINIWKKGTSESGSDTPGSDSQTSDEVKTVTIAEFNAAAESNDVWYQLTGTVKNLKDGDQYGNFDLEDETGSVYVYGVLSEKGGEKKKFQELVAAKGIKNGDKLTIIGNRGSYTNKTTGETKIEVMNAYFIKVEAGSDTPDPQTSEELKVVTVADFNAAEESTNIWYQLTGTVKNLKDNDQYGNFDLEDATGSVYVYGLLAEKGGAKKKFQELAAAKGIQNGSKITLIGNRGSYNDKIEVLNAYFVSIEEATEGQVWDFTKWSDATVAALKADAAASKTAGWSDVEKAADAEAGADPTEASKDNCFWSVAEPNADGTLSANGVVIEELKGLVWNSAYSTKRSLAIAVNYPSTSLGDYAGGAYLWLGGGKNKIPCFTIPGVKAGSTITIEAESHKPAEGRGVELYTGLDADNLVDAATMIGDSFKPKTKEAHNWTIEKDCDVIVYNTNGCHIYKIEITAGTAGIQAVKTVKSGNGFIYNLAGQRVDANYKGVVIKNGQKMIQK